MSGLIENNYAPPQWLDENFLQCALREGLRRGSLNVTSCTIKPATHVGDNYLSQMFRASTKIHSRRKGSENMSVLIKSMPKGEAIEKFVNESNFFTRETSMMAETLPLLQSVLDEADGQCLFAHMYFKQDSPNNSLVLEDLCESGFRPVNRLPGLDIHHSILVVEYMAIFHAASLVAIQRNPAIKKDYKHCFWQRHNEKNIQKFLKQDTDTLLDCIKTWKNFPNEMIEKLEKLKITAPEKLYQSTDFVEDEFNVLNHGDVWSSNVMFKYSNGLPVDLRFVDFQLSCYLTPVFDLLYFLFTSPANNIKISRLDLLLEKYHMKLEETCKRLNYPLNFTLGDLRETFFKRMFFGFFALTVLLPFQTANSSVATDLNDYLEEGADDEITGSRAASIVNNVRYRDAVETILPFLDEQGILD